jgi:phosphoribosylformimino-5-aminoimidazole carboxamide ribotide isomerase
MLLVIPAVEIKGGKCVQMVQGTEGFVYSDDPVEMARLWRKENAKSLHVTDVDGAAEGHLINTDVIERMIQTVDIPIELGGGLRTFDDVERAFRIGAYRVVVGTMLIEDPDAARKAIEKYSASNVVFGMDVENGIVKTRGWKDTSGLTPISAALNAKALGFRRIVYTDILRDGTLRGPNFAAIRELAEKTGMRVTASGGVANLDQLLKLQEFEPLGVDSVVIGRALYANRFSCQEIWRLCEAGGFPYTAKV